MTRAGLDHLQVLAGLQREVLTTLDQVDHGARVPWCGRWRVRDVVVHLARVHHWAAAQARREREAPLGRGPFDVAELYGRCAEELLTTLDELGADAPAWTLEGPGVAAFWHRRQVHEALVHLWDVRTAGDLPVDAPAAVWADTVDEVVTVLQPRQVRLGRMPRLTTTVDLVATDADRTWQLGTAATDDRRVRVHGTAEALALLLWRRPLEDGAVRVQGAADALDEALALPLTP